MAQNKDGFLHRLVGEHLTPALKARGFMTKGWAARRAIGSLSHLLEIQPGRWNAEGRGSFTVNLGVFMPSVFSAVWARPSPLWPSTVDAVINRRIGDVMPGGITLPGARGRQNRDYWWNYDPTTDFDQLVLSVLASIIDYALPFLEQFVSAEQVDRFMSESIDSPSSLPVEYLYLAVLKAELGDRQTARRLLQLASDTYPAWVDRARDTELRLGLGSVSIDRE